MQRQSFKSLLYQCFIFFFFLYFLFFVLRLLFFLYIGVYQSELGEASLDDIFKSAYNAFRYDGQIIGALAVLFFLLRIFSYKIAKFYAFITILITVFVNIANIGFYEIYKDVFNATLLGLVFDDKKAIFDTALSGDFNLGFKFLIWLILSVFFYIILKFLLQISSFDENKKSYIKNFALFIIFALLSTFAINSTFGFKGISLGKELVPVENIFLRKTTFGGFRDLFYVFKAYKQIYNSNFKDYIDEDPLQVAKAFVKDKNISEQNSSINLLKALEHTVKNPSHKEVKHIFYLIAESYSAWHFDEEFDELNLSSAMKELLKSPHAFKAKNFLQDASGTIKSLDVQISGLLQFEIPLNLSVGKSPVFETSPGFIFKKLGYKNYFYYAGSGTWQRIDAYTASQGFDNIFYNTNIINFAKENGLKAPFANAWGAYDHHLYDFIRANTKKDEKTFSMILSTSYHPPHDVPLEQFDIPFDKIDSFIEKNKNKIANKELARKVLSHIYYQDKQIANFIQKTSKEFPDSLFVVTGDHYDMKYIYGAESLNIRNQIPFILYAPSLDFSTVYESGSHIDIVPSIVNLVAKDGFKYSSFGKAMLSTDKTSSLQNRDRILGYLASANDRFITDSSSIEYFKDKQKQEKDLELAKDLMKDLKRAKALSWWIFYNGYELYEDKLDKY